MDKLGRNYLLQVQNRNGEYIPIAPPFTLEFDITRHSLQSTNVGQFRIYNLSERTRNEIRHNRIDYNFTNRGIILYAGYGSNLPAIFRGTVSTAWSVREGVNFITQIESFDGGYDITNGFTDVNFKSGTSYDLILKTLASSFPRSTIGAIGNYPGSIQRGSSYSGNTAFLLNKLTGGGFFIDRERVYCLGSNEYVLDPPLPITISSKSGLLGTPVLEETIVHFDMIFEPALNIGQAIILDSITDNNFNRLYKLTKVKHRGMISASVCGDAITTCEFSYTEGGLKGVQPVG